MTPRPAPVGRVPTAFMYPRFVCPLNATGVDDGGFLLDPESEYSHRLQPDVVPLHRVASQRCVILLGEPGSGKSEALRSLSQDDPGQGRVQNLANFVSDHLLVQRVFESSELVAWRNAAHGEYTLTLDSFDECLLRVDTLAALLPTELEQLPLERLRLRIACRSAVWPSRLGERLRELFGADQVGVYVLQPLRRADAQAAASAFGLNPDAFLREVVVREAVPLAARPITLRFLLAEFARVGRLPDSQVDLYCRGCEHLCTEHSGSRQDAGRRGALTVGQRYRLAGRLAAQLLLCRRTSIATDDTVPLEDDVLRTRDTFGSESGDNLLFQVTDAAVREVLDTALFSQRAEGQFAFAHQTYAEFLAADYLADRLPPDQILRLITHQSEEAGRAVPQLHEVAAWVATLVPEIAHELLARDAPVLLGSDLPQFSPAFRQQLTESILTLAREHRLVDTNWALSRRFHRLAHPNLADQLRPVITDRTAAQYPRRISIDIGQECRLADLDDALLAIALDPTDNYHIRVQAADAVCHSTNTASITSLRPLVFGAAHDDRDDRLKGLALRALFPAHLTAEEVFAHLNWPQNTSMVAAYSVFIGQELPASLTTDHLPHALAWLGRNPHAVRGINPFERLVERIIALAWASLDLEWVRTPFARLVLACLNDHHPVQQLTQTTGEEDNRRRWLLFDTLLPMWLAANVEPRTVLWTRTPVVTLSDADEVFTRTIRETDHDRQVWLAGLAAALTGDDAASVERMIDGSARCPALEEVFAPRLRPVLINSEEARRLREGYADVLRRHREWDRQEQEGRSPPPDPPPAIVVDRFLDESEAGDHTAWVRINEALRIRADGRYVGMSERDVTDLPGWTEAAPVARGRVVMAAERFLHTQPAPGNGWIDGDQIPPPVWAGFCALWLLHREALDRLTQLPTDVWERWATAVIACPPAFEINSAERHNDLARRAYTAAPDAVTVALGCLLMCGIRHRRRVTVGGLVRGWLDGRIGAVLLDYATRPRQTDPTRDELVELLIASQHSRPGAVAYLLTLVPDPPPTPRYRRQRPLAVWAACLLLRYAPGMGWAAVWAAVQREPAFGREVLGALAHRWDRIHALPAMSTDLSSDQLADLYLWLLSQYPTREDEGPAADGVISPRASMGEFRDSMLTLLRDRGSPVAVAAIERISRQHPDNVWLRYVVEVARQNALRSTWLPPEPSELLRLVEDTSRRLVESGEQLLAVVRESMARLEAELQGETPTAPGLWNFVEGRHTPKDEAALSDHIAAHLRRDLRERGVVVNREVEIRREEGGAPGERTDIHISATANDAGERLRVITVIVEVKGCWNPGRETDLADQLRDRYLHDNNCRHGLYVVGWFNCPQWDVTNRRTRRAPVQSLAEARTQFTTLAQQASRDGIVIHACVLNTALR